MNTNNKKRKIVITTFFGSENYGSNLQAIGLATTLEELGYEVFFLEAFKNRLFLLKHPALLISRLKNKINKKKYYSFFVPNPYVISDERKEKLIMFNNKHYKTVNYKKWRDWNTAIKDNTIFIAGSDIIWNPAKGYPATTFLDFAYYAGLPRFSYASSIGDNKLPQNYYRAYRKYLGTMIEVGVREQIVADLLAPIIGKSVKKVLDPSMLLNKDQWDSFANDAEISSSIERGRYLLCYFVMKDERYWRYVENIRKKTGLQVVVLPMHNEDEKDEYETVLNGTVNEFIWLVKNAAIICTDSFHACVTSLLYEKEFYLLRRTRKAEDAKFDELLSHYHLLDRIVTNEEDFYRIAETDYAFVREQLTEDRCNSLAFLKNTLEKVRTN